ncbi:hypothetical protein [Halobiforma nitratireducens]|uniref:Pirin domain protein n=1 Tax=Halobiforma nitratireducens JCM 10879 TaxID=1227454 RepID=M0MLF0_9EURY|nr:hypothetical protein [Halobiforma nitratireducens]EMA46213.1 Pirin domain protein [Halobiforma nitratireducens JCM 10879]
MTAGTERTLYDAPVTNVCQGQGSFRISVNFPGCSLPITTITATAMAPHGGRRVIFEPDTLTPMHPNRNEEIVSWVPDGVRFDEREQGLVVGGDDSGVGRSRPNRESLSHSGRRSQRHKSVR